MVHLLTQCSHAYTKYDEEHVLLGDLLLSYFSCKRFILFLLRWAFTSEVDLKINFNLSTVASLTILIKSLRHHNLSKFIQFFDFYQFRSILVCHSCPKVLHITISILGFTPKSKIIWSLSFVFVLEVSSVVLVQCSAWQSKSFPLSNCVYNRMHHFTAVSIFLETYAFVTSNVNQ